MHLGTWGWVLFNLFVVVMLILDLGVFHRKAHKVTIREAMIWTCVWIGLALGFNVLIWQTEGRQPALEFLTGYVIEKSLSVDNLFVFLLVFHYFQVPAIHQHRVLFWGILGALVIRGIFIGVGAALISQFSWLLYIFAAFLIYSGWKLIFEKDAKVEPEKNPVLRLFRRWVPVSNTYHGSHFFIREAGRLTATPLFVVLIVIETTDVIFAVDSIPAIFGITKDPFIIYTSNVFAILGLRSLYFALAGLMQLFHYLHYGLAFVLIFVGVKMVLHESGIFHMPIAATLGVVGGVLTLSVLASLYLPQPKEEEELQKSLEESGVHPKLTGDPPPPLDGAAAPTDGAAAGSNDACLPPSLVTGEPPVKDKADD